MYCEKCGNFVPDSAKFCVKCGALTGNDSTENMYASQKTENLPNQNMQAGMNQQQSPMQQGNYNGQNFQNGSFVQNNGYPNGVGNFAGSAGNVAAGVAKHAGNAKRNALISLLVVGVFAILFLLYSVFLKTGTPEDTIAKLETGMNNMDQAMVMECFDEQINSMISGSMGILDSLTGLPIGDISEFASGLGGFMSAAGLTPKVTLVIENISYSPNKKSCIATVTMYMEYMGESEVETVELPMVLKDREWLISVSDLSSFMSYY